MVVLFRSSARAGWMATNISPPPTTTISSGISTHRASFSVALVEPLHQAVAPPVEEQHADEDEDRAEQPADGKDQRPRLAPLFGLGRLGQPDDQERGRGSGR